MDYSILVHIDLPIPYCKCINVSYVCLTVSNAICRSKSVCGKRLLMLIIIIVYATVKNGNLLYQLSPKCFISTVVTFAWIGIFKTAYTDLYWYLALCFMKFQCWVKWINFSKYACCVYISLSEYMIPIQFA